VIVDRILDKHPQGDHCGYELGFTTKAMIVSIVCHHGKQLSNGNKHLHDDTLDHGVGVFPSGFGLPEAICNDASEDDIGKEDIGELVSVFFY
jgi:hypothetical protein